MADQIRIDLEAEYCPPLDPALLSAILSDFDLEDAQAVRDVRATLEPLKESALLEEHIGFDASGTGGAHGFPLEREAHGESLPDTSGGSQSRDTELTSLSNGLSSIDLGWENGGAEGGAAGELATSEELEKLDEETKICLLLDMFGKRVSQYSVRHTLRKCNGRWNAAMEELLNHIYFEEAEDSDGGGRILAKGIDAFAEENVVKRGRRIKTKNNRLKGTDGTLTAPVSPATVAGPLLNKWDKAEQDIEFIVSRTGLTAASVSSTYYQHGATLARTISAVLRASIDNGSSAREDETVTANARELGREFPSISPAYLIALIRLTHPSTASAHELAKALTARNPQMQPGGLQIITNYQRPEDHDEKATAQPGNRNLQHAGIHVVDSAVLNDADASTRARAYAAARSTAFAQAQAAHRRARSDRLMGGAAAYYGQMSRDYAALSFHASASAADELADAQSSAGQLDLHGVDVLNAIRIAQSKVEQWWRELGESRVNGRVGADERQAGYCIVVGLGRHSEGGKSKIGPAVKKTLRDGGWRFEDRGATILVRGRAKK